MIVFERLAQNQKILHCALCNVALIRPNAMHELTNNLVLRT